MTSAIQTELQVLAVYEARDVLMRRYAFGEAQATEIAELLIGTLAALSDEELIQVKRTVTRMKRRQRDARIRAALRTGNADEVARQENLSRSRVYEIANERD